MKILVTGRGGAGSWEIRAKQVGEALGAKVCQMATVEEMKQADVILVVKRVPLQLLTALRKSGRPWVYDILDAFPQPECSSWSPEQSRAWVKGHVDRLAPNAVIWPNQRMREDAGGKGKVIYHHARPNQTINPIRERIETIGYEGSANYVEAWMHAISAECKRLKAGLIINPKHISDADVILAVRGDRWNGYPQQNWKSNVKLANAHATGTPFVGMLERGYVETAAGGEMFINAPEDLRRAIEALEDYAVRQRVHEQFLPATRTLERAAAETLEVLRAVC